MGWYWTGLCLDKYVLRLRGLPKYSHSFSLVQTLGLFFFENAGEGEKTKLGFHMLKTSTLSRDILPGLVAFRKCEKGEPTKGPL